MRQKGATGEAAIAEIAARQHGVVSFAQLRAAGMSGNGVARRARVGRLHRIHQGVYAVGHPAVTPEGRWMAAVLACGDDVVISHRSAAALWGMLEPRSGVVEISVPGIGGKKKRKGIRLHRSRTLTPDLTTRRKNIPVTKPGRTIADLRPVVTPKELRRAIRQAEVLGLPLGAEVKSDRTRSDLELLFLRLCKRYRLPEPAVNERIGPFTVDFLWRDQRLVVETDGYKYHRGHAAYLDDHDRDLRLRALGYEVVRLSEDQVANEPSYVARVVRSLLKGDSVIAR